MDSPLKSLTVAYASATLSRRCFSPALLGTSLQLSLSFRSWLELRNPSGTSCQTHQASMY